MPSRKPQTFAERRSLYEFCELAGREVVGDENTRPGSNIRPGDRIESALFVSVAAVGRSVVSDCPGCVAHATHCLIQKTYILIFGNQYDVRGFAGNVIQREGTAC